MTSLFRRGAPGAVLMVLLCSGAQAGIMNGDFTSGLTGWSTAGLDSSFSPSAGDVSVDPSDEEAAVGDGGAVYSALYQGAALGAERYAIEFDFRNLLSASTPGGTFPDTFFASVYLTDDLTTLDIANGVFDDVIALFDLDSSGVSCAFGPGPCIGAVGASSAKGAGWSRFAATFASTDGLNARRYANAVPAFELFDGNFVDADSRVLVDNVALASVPAPEPSSLILTLAPLALFGLRRRGHAGPGRPRGRLRQRQ